MADKTHREPLRFLVVIAHPHDFTHCAGTCGIHRNMGDSVTVVVMTDGGRKHNEGFMDELRKPETDRDPEIMKQTPESYAAQKAEEFRKVCALFDVTDIRILPFPEPFRLSRSPEAVEALEDIIRDVRPHVMITHSPVTTSPVGISHHGMGAAILNDHRETAITALEARVRPSGTPDYENQKQAHIIAATYYLGIDVMPDQGRLLRRHIPMEGATLPGGGIVRQPGPGRSLRTRACGNRSGRSGMARTNAIRGGLRQIPRGDPPLHRGFRVGHDPRNGIFERPHPPSFWRNHAHSGDIDAPLCEFDERKRSRQLLGTRTQMCFVLRRPHTPGRQFISASG